MKPTLLVLAAGMGSRYGGQKQTDEFGPSGETITDYSIYDALQSGFGKIVFVIAPRMEKEFNESYLKRFPSDLEIEYVLQDVKNVPDGFIVPEDRKKPWGTAHAVLMAKDVINEPFAVINADDFYGRESYKTICEFLVSAGKGEYALVGFTLSKTVSEHGSVARGVCETDENGFLTEVVERTKIFSKEGKIWFVEEDGSEHDLDPQTKVSMNLFGFTPDIFEHLERQFKSYIAENINSQKAEFFIPFVADHLIRNKQASFKVLGTPETWFGVTYQEDRPHVVQMIKRLTDQNMYPTPIWG
ncbi:MAG TPA: sugar phosphate nucleotidyltransferase [Bacteroidales bacterium]|nr:sugar phosphate nucleotidyltransferase [Bacteroidales bacterium]